MSIEVKLRSGKYLHTYTQCRIYGLPALSGYHFGLELTGERGAINDNDTYRLSQLKLSLSLPEPQLHIAQATLQRQPTVELYSHSNTNLYFTFELSGNGIEKLEQYRSQSDRLALKLDLSGIIEFPLSGIVQPLKRALSIELARWTNDQLNKRFPKQSQNLQFPETQPIPEHQNCGFWSSDTLSISTNEWLKALEQAGYQKSLFFEVSLPEFDQVKYTKLQTLIKEVKFQIAHGKYDTAVSTCRKIIEEIDTRHKQELTEESEITRGLKNRKNTVQQRLSLMKKSLWHTINLGAHGDHSESFSRQQAQSLFAFTVSLLPLLTDLEAIETEDHQQ